MSEPARRWRVYDAPELRAQVATPAGEHSAEVLLAVDGVHCAACVRRVTRVLGDRVSDLNVDLPSRTLEFRHDPQHTPLSELLASLDDAGFTPQVLAQDADAGAERRARRAALGRIGVAAIGAMQVMMLAWPGYVDATELPGDIAAVMRWAQWVIASGVVFYAGWPLLLGGWRSLASRVPTMDLPVAASLVIAWSASSWRVVQGHGDLYFDAATMFVLLLSLGRYLEGRTRAIAGNRLRRLASQRVLTAMRESADDSECVPIEQLRPGDVVRVAPGETVPGDARLLDEQAELDESLLSGEAQAICRRRDEPLLAGSINAGAAPLRATVTATGAATRLAQIVRLLQQATRDKPRFQLIADRMAGYFVLVVLTLAAIGALSWWLHSGSLDDALQVALAVLVVSCPCALSLAMPAVFAATSGQLARRGVLLASPSSLARLEQVDTVLFDKTGTLTGAQLEVRQVIALAELDRARCLAYAATLERDLKHPIAAAFRKHGSELRAERVQIDPRGGVSGRINDKYFWLGAAERAAAWSPDLARHFELAPQASWLLLSDAERPLALLALHAELRSEAQTVVAELHRDGLAVELLTGDSEASARALAHRVGIDTLRARQTPEQKLERLRDLQAAGHVVMAVGDGINDAPFLAAADVAVAMPAGASLAQARADAILVGDSLAGLGELRALAQTAQLRIRQNLGWAVAYNLAMLPLALANLLTPWAAALGMSVSSLLVVGNALRLNRRTASWKRSTC